MLEHLKTLLNSFLRRFNRPLVILVEKTNRCAEMPRKMHDNDAGFDVEAISQKYLKEFAKFFSYIWLPFLPIFYFPRN